MPDNKSILTCPKCGFQENLLMPSDSCQIFHICTNCHSMIKPKEGDCCIFCSYGSKSCPSKQ
ncbi:MAG: GDCCVxC domain-containing (seleno)protein [Candidatus Hodarchaeales archaeon]